MTPEEFLETKGICSDTTIGIEGDIPLTELLLEYANQALRQPPVVGRSEQLVCDCQDFENGMVSNYCTVHNERPYIPD